MLSPIFSLPVVRTSLIKVRNMASLAKVLEKLEEFAPIETAESWDNVGLLLEPSEPK
jgi:NIF3 (NGG1p interacting factor 3)